MANECQGLWASTLVFLIKGGAVKNPPVVEQDGNIDVGAHGTSTTFSGKHVNTNKNLTNTDCRRVTVDGQLRRRIRFTREISASEVVDYEGFITDGQLISGTFLHRGGGSEDGDTGTWGATKQMGLAPGKGRAASKKGGSRRSGRKG